MKALTTSLSIVVVGCGRLGSALAPALGAGPPLPRDAEVPRTADVVILAVPDTAIASVAANLGAGPVLGHCSGALGLEVLAPHAERFSLHPLMTLAVGAGPERLHGAGAAVAASSAYALAVANELAARAGLAAFSIDDDDRALYHAGATMASNFLVTLEAAADRVLGSVGVEHRHVAALAEASLANWNALGAASALTGPIVRGDTATVSRQRAAVAAREPSLLRLFDALVDATRALAATAG